MSTTPRSEVSAVDKARRWTASVLLAAGLVTGGVALHLAGTTTSTSAASAQTTSSGSTTSSSSSSTFGSTGSLTGSSGSAHTTTRGS